MIQSRIRWTTAVLVAGVMAAALPVTAAATEDEVEQKRAHRIVIQRSGDDHEVDVRRIIDLEHHGLGVHGLGGGFLGVRLVDLTPELRTHFGVPEGAGVLVSAVVDDSPAFRAGIEVGDIVTGLDGEPVTSSRALSHAVRGRDDGETVVVELWRDGRLETASAAIENRRPEGIHRAMMMGHPLGLDCESGDCFVEVRCEEEGDCSCEVNGEERDCDTLPGPHSE
jgi:membrane-associated protease RseP (regulator of RpoE activity)